MQAEVIQHESPPSLAFASFLEPLRLIKIVAHFYFILNFDEFIANNYTFSKQQKLYKMKN